MSNIIPDYWVPVNKNLAGDFIGFTFDNIHSSDFNLIRVSNGSRYESNLLPSFQDATVQGEGKDGMFYFGSTFREKIIKISTAFDDLTEENYRKLAETFSDKKLHKLWFDETPYKAYYVKLKQTPLFKNLCFDEVCLNDEKEEIIRKYRGEMDLEFTCLPSWGEARASYLDQILPQDEFVLVFFKGNNTNLMHNHILVGENDGEENNSFQYAPKQFYKYYGKDGATLMDSYNLDEWKVASRLDVKVKSGEQKETVENFEIIEISEGELFPIYNPGDKEANLRIIFTPKSIANDNKYNFPSTKFYIYSKKGEDLEITSALGIKEFSFDEEDKHIVIDSYTHLISGLNEDKKLSGKVYNKYHIAGDFFEIPKSKHEDQLYLKIENGVSGTWKLEYKFYYV